MATDCTCVVPVCRALQPELRGGVIEVLVTCLVFIGALAGSIVPVAFNLEFQATTTTKRLPSNLYSLVSARLGQACCCGMPLRCCVQASRAEPGMSLSVTGISGPVAM